MLVLVKQRLRRNRETSTLSAKSYFYFDFFISTFTFTSTSVHIHLPFYRSIYLCLSFNPSTLQPWAYINDSLYLLIPPISYLYYQVRHIKTSIHPSIHTTILSQPILSYLISSHPIPSLSNPPYLLSRHSKVGFEEYRFPSHYIKRYQDLCKSLLLSHNASTSKNQSIGGEKIRSNQPITRHNYFQPFNLKKKDQIRKQHPNFINPRYHHLLALPLPATPLHSIQHNTTQHSTTQHNTPETHLENTQRIDTIRSLPLWLQVAVAVAIIVAVAVAVTITVIVAFSDRESIIERRYFTTFTSLYKLSNLKVKFMFFETNQQIFYPPPTTTTYDFATEKSRVMANRFRNAGTTVHGFSFSIYPLQ
ncbi:hypothetical protein EYC84_006987 [Monilinia fructicola]|uniref:Uncharacterized protein n=1 Tax=Monilinia fructicola TaxID=38448 RepID=A0A5M9K8X0_MONFR|nr:hypothetical protein EYC84_006987 [Monilinia fructicola]